MALLYNSSPPKIITYQGNDVKKIVHKGITIWQKSKDFILNSAYSLSTLNLYASATATSSVATTSAGTANPFLVLNTTATNDRVPILYAASDSSPWILYWVSASYATRNMTHNDTVSTEDKLVVTSSGTNVYWKIYSDVDCTTILKNFQPTQPFFIIKEGPFTNSNGATVYKVQGNDINDGVATDYTGYISTGSTYISIVDLSSYDIMELV